MKFSAKPMPPYGRIQPNAFGNIIAAAVNRRLSLMSTTREPLGTDPSAIVVVPSKNAWSSERYRPPRDRVISVSPPSIGAWPWRVVVVQYVMFPAFAPQNQESLK